MVKLLSADDVMLQEPRKVFINVILIRSIREIQEAIFVHGQPREGIRLMRGLIRTLHSKSKQKLKKIMNKLVEYEDNPSLATRMNIEEMYDDIMTYLHGTWLKEFGIRPFNPNPRHISDWENQEKAKETPAKPKPQHIG